MRIIFFAIDPHNFRGILGKILSNGLFGSSVALWVTLGYLIIIYWLDSQLIAFLHLIPVRVELVHQIKKFERTFSHTMCFKVSLVITTAISFGAVLIVGSLVSISRAFLFIYSILAAVFLLSHVVLLGYSAFSFYRILHRNDNNVTLKSISQYSNSHDKYLLAIVKRLVLLGSLLLLYLILELIFVRFAENAFGFVIFEFLFRTTELAILLVTLHIVFLRTNDPPKLPAGASSEHMSVQNVSSAQPDVSM